MTSTDSSPSQPWLTPANAMQQINYAGEFTQVRIKHRLRTRSDKKEVNENSRTQTDPAVVISVTAAEV